MDLGRLHHESSPVGEECECGEWANDAQANCLSTQQSRELAHSQSGCRIVAFNPLSISSDCGVLRKRTAAQPLWKAIVAGSLTLTVARGSHVTKWPWQAPPLSLSLYYPLYIVHPTKQTPDPDNNVTQYMTDGLCMLASNMDMIELPLAYPSSSPPCGE